MKLLDFRITNFRSIRDSGWCPFSTDEVTVLIGQNESGKSSILSALEKALTDVDLDDDDIRIHADLPKIFLRFSLSQSDVTNLTHSFAKIESESFSLAKKHLLNNRGRVEWSVTWSKSSTKTKTSPYITVRNIDDNVLKERLLKFDVSDAEVPADLEEVNGAAGSGSLPAKATPELIADALYFHLPEAILFEEKSGLLPNRVSIVEKAGDYRLDGEGSEAARNFLAIAGIDLSGLMTSDERSRESLLRRGNENVSRDFVSFWNQTIGKKERIALSCSLRFGEANVSERAGQPYLVFWISDGQNHLFPKQRSTGVRWFISFYLQLKAAELIKNGNTLFLLDEPGANLHSRAQSDVLNLINKLEHRQIMYSTHSPHMIEYEKLYRILAVQRNGDEDETPTTVISAHKLGAASRDTLSPILTAMGADLSQQEVVKKRNNVILEEISALYYLRGIWKLVFSKNEAYFIAATGVSNVELLANMFLGWGLEFIIIVDDDSAGRSAAANIKKNMFGGDDELAKNRLARIPYKGIEDVFSGNDFKKFILGDIATSIKTENSQYVKDKNLAKALVAHQFSIKCEKGEIKFSDLEKSTQDSMRNLEATISKMLASSQ